MEEYFTPLTAMLVISDNADEISDEITDMIN